MEKITLDYFYGNQSEYFNFYQVPKVLFTSNRFRVLSSDAKLLYSLMLDRTSLSRKNGWFDDKNRVYIIYSNEKIAKDLGISNGTITKLKAELNSERLQKNMTEQVHLPTKMVYLFPYKPEYPKLLFRVKIFNIVQIFISHIITVP